MYNYLVTYLKEEQNPNAPKLLTPTIYAIQTYSHGYSIYAHNEKNIKRIFWISVGIFSYYFLCRLEKVFSY